MELTKRAPLRTFATRVQKISAARALPGDPTVLKNDCFNNDLLKGDLPRNNRKASQDSRETNDSLNRNLNDGDCWQTYRTRFTIRARILSAPLSFVDALGREQNGKRGDYLVESNGVVTITPRRIFEDVYVPLKAESAERRQPAADGPPRKSPISTKKNGFFPASRRRSL